MASEKIKNSVIRDNLQSNRVVHLIDGIRDVIDSREFQRLRHIRQMGLASYVFPGAEHSRFAHSIGVYANALLAFDALKPRASNFGFQYSYAFDERTRKDFAIAALCHDVGHAAFSHVLEDVLLPDGYSDHEACTAAILQNPDSGIRSSIDRILGADIDAVLQFLNRRHPNKALATLISGPFDMDRCDYLARDGQMSGVDYGRFDFSWLLHSMDIERNSQGGPTVVLDGSRGIDALRQFFAARKHMHRQVYFHPTVRSAQKHLRGIIERIRDLVQDKKAPALPRFFDFFAQGKRPTLDQFQMITDVEIHYLVRVLADDAQDATLRYLCQSFLSRKHPKSVFDSSKHLGMGDLNIEAETSSNTINFDLFESSRGKPISQIIAELKEFVSKELTSEGIPSDVKKYLVAYDPVSLKSSSALETNFRIGSKTYSIDALLRLDKSNFKADVPEMFSTFTLHRIYVPRETYRASLQWLVTNCGLGGES